MKNNNYVYGLLGKGISHSFSPKLHSYIGDYKYELFDFDETAAKNFILSKNYNGLNVTMPYKKLAFCLSDKLSYTAEVTGSVNTIVNKNGLIYGYNTDYDGFKGLIVKNKIDFKDKKIVILGSGGVSNTVQAVVKEMQAGSIIVVSRHGEDNYDNIHKHFDADIVINATPVGMFPNSGGEIIDISKFKKCENVIDLIYNPLRTRLLCKSKLCGKNIFNGLYMLVIQGIKASNLFLDKESRVCEDDIVKTLDNNKRNIVLIGMPGVGKSTLGIYIAEKLGIKFIDTDKEIYNLFKKYPEEIISCEGEKVFRDIEKNVINKVSKEERAVISTGGGAVLDEENMLNLMSNGLIFFIKRNFSLLDKNCGPILRSGGIEALYDKRKGLYKKYCDFTVYNNCSVSETAKNIIHKYEKS